MLITEELTKLGLVFNSEGLLGLRHCNKNSEISFVIIIIIIIIIQL